MARSRGQRGRRPAAQVMEEPPQSARSREWPWLFVPAAAVLLLCAPLLMNGPLPRGSDVYAITHYLAGFLNALGEGEWAPGWSAETNQGLGGPAFVLFPPLFFYAAGAAAWVAGGLIVGLKFYLVLVAALSALAFYLLARDWAGPGLPAAAGAALYLLLPYHVLDMYQRFAMPETTAFVFLPLILLCARRLLHGGGAGSWVGLVFSYAGLAYTHLVSTLLFSLLLGVWLLWEARGRWLPLARVAAALALGGALAAPAVVPAMLEKSFVNIDWVKEMPNGDFRINFIFEDKVLPVIGVKDIVKPLVLRSALAQLVFAAGAAGIALWGFRAKEKDRRRLIAGMAAGCAVAYLLQLRLSTPIWLLIPELPTIQFPWRFQTVMVLASALLAAFALAAPAHGARRPAAAALLGILLLPSLVFAARFAYEKPFDYGEEALALVSGPTVWIEPALTPVQFERYKRFRFDKMTFPEQGFIEGEGRVESLARSSARRRVELSSTAGGTARMRLFWFPGWTGRIDGEPIELRPSVRDGLVTFDVPPGSHTVDLAFEMTPVRRASWWAALGALVTALVPVPWWSGRFRGSA